MMKKGFTLAEVLITLTIIGVVAVLTLPGLMTNTQEQQARAALKKMTNTFSQAAEMNAAIAGFNYASLAGGAVMQTASSAKDGYDTATGETASLAKIFVERLDLDQGVIPAPPGVATGDNNVALTFSASPVPIDSAVYLKDGTAIYFGNTVSTTTQADCFKNADDGLMVGIPVLFDTNGKKAPNAVSSCNGGIAAATWSSDDGSNCTNKKDRFIRDIYMMRLRDSSVYPLGAASTWMLDDTQKEARDINRFGTSTTD